MPAPAASVAVLGTGSMATAVATLLAGAGAGITVWGRDPEHVAWVLDDVYDAVPAARMRGVATAREAVGSATVVVPALPWGATLSELLTTLADELPGRTVLDVANPYELTPLGPKLALYVPGGSAAAGTLAVLPEGVGYVHALTHVTAEAVLTGARLGAVLPYVSVPPVHTGAAPDAGPDLAPDAGPGADSGVSRGVEETVALLAASGWDPVRIGGAEAADLVEAGGPWASAVSASLAAASAGRAPTTGLLTRAEAATAGLLP